MFPSRFLLSVLSSISYQSFTPFPYFISSPFSPPSSSSHPVRSSPLLLLLCTFFFFSSSFPSVLHQLFLLITFTRTSYFSFSILCFSFSPSSPLSPPTASILLSYPVCLLCFIILILSISLLLLLFFFHILFLFYALLFSYCSSLSSVPLSSLLLFSISSYCFYSSFLSCLSFMFYYSHIVHLYLFSPLSSLLLLFFLFNLLFCILTSSSFSLVS